MRVLLTSTASYDPPRGGSTRSNLAWLRHLASVGHVCRVVSASAGEDGESTRDGISIRSLQSLSRRAAELIGEISAFHPDWVLVSSEDLSHGLLRQASRAAPDRLVYLAHTPQFLPFGPESWNRDAAATSIVRSARAVITIGRHMSEYVTTHAGASSTLVHPPIYGTPPFRRLGLPDSGFVLMINPCAVKGLAIFLALARRFPTLPFAALRGWGTTSRDLAEIARVPNVSVLETVPGIEDVLARARLLLMPSLWYEGFGLIAMEAMLRGLPVIASDSGGLLEAKTGTGYVIPVRPIERYLSCCDEVHMPEPEIPEQDLEPWAEAVEVLSGNRTAWESESERSRTAALQFVSAVRPGDFEACLEGLAAAAAASPVPQAAALSDARRALLLDKLRKARTS